IAVVFVFTITTDHGLDDGLPLTMADIETTGTRILQHFLHYVSIALGILHTWRVCRVHDAGYMQALPVIIAAVFRQCSMWYPYHGIVLLACWYYFSARNYRRINFIVPRRR
ncbi:hypothetical protein PMAYCL1PPCAC_26745, partial [Pristionchus mayeri]